MTIVHNAPMEYSDMQSLMSLRSSAKHNQNEALDAVAKQFESMFIQMLLKSMRQANEVFKSDLVDSEKVSFYKDMYDHQLSLHLSRQNGIGISDMLVKQLSPKIGREASTLFKDSKTENEKLTANESSQSLAVSTERKENAIAIASDINKEPFASTREFVSKLLPSAVKAAKLLHLDPKVLVSQAALETGWGKKLIKSSDGEHSHNLFGIKADKSWVGDKVTVTTHEVLSGQRIKIKDEFRSYSSYEEGFEDYVRFLQENPRYRKALNSTHSPKEFVNELQKAGYATDPNYAKKITQIMNGKDVSELFERLI